MTYDLLVGTYTRNTFSEGVYSYLISGLDARLNMVSKGIDNPSFLVQHPRIDVVFGVNEVDDFQGESSGAVTAYRYNADSSLKLLNQRASMGADPCHLTVSPTGNYLLVSNYSGGNFTSLPVDDTGCLGEFTSLVSHTGSAHVHSTTLSDSSEFIYVADLGLDQIVRYPVNMEGQVDDQLRKISNMTAGSGPRHFCFSNGFGYLFNELDSTVVSFVSEHEELLMAPGAVSSLPGGFSGKSEGAHIEASRDGKYLYASNRGHDSIVVFEIGDKGQIKPVQFQPTLGEHPRHFAFSPDQNFLLVANRDTDNVVIFRRNAETGLLEETGSQFEVPAPVFLLPMAARSC